MMYVPLNTVDWPDWYTFGNPVLRTKPRAQAIAPGCTVRDSHLSPCHAASHSHRPAAASHTPFSSQSRLVRQPTDETAEMESAYAYALATAAIAVYRCVRRLAQISGIAIAIAMA